VALAGHGGISEEQVAAIRAIHDVEIAAPIAWVGLTTTATTAPSIEITRFPSKPTLYSATLKVSTNDGVQSHLVFQDSLRILIAPDGGANGGPTVLSDVGDAIIGPLPGGGWVADLSDGHVVPQVQSPIIAVDPDAERALLGDRGAFLDPLVKLKNRDSLTVGTTDPHIVLRDYDQGADIAIMQQGGGKALSRPVFPVLVSARTYAPFQVTIDVSQIGHPLASLACAFLALRVDLQSRRGEFHVLEATGWRPGQIGRMMTWSRFFISIPTALLAGLFAGLLSHPIAGSDVSAPVISALGGIVALVITLASGRLAEVRATGR
jgi:Predicted permease.